MKTFVVAWFLVGGVWYPGEFFVGWDRIQVPETVEECQLIADDINANDDTLSWMLDTVDGATDVYVECTNEAR